MKNSCNHLSRIIGDKCKSCGNSYCKDCVSKCKDCGDPLCINCKSDEGICHSCENGITSVSYKINNNPNFARCLDCGHICIPISSKVIWSNKLENCFSGFIDITIAIVLSLATCGTTGIYNSSSYNKETYDNTYNCRRCKKDFKYLTSRTKLI